MKPTKSRIGKLRMVGEKKNTKERASTKSFHKLTRLHSIKFLKGFHLHLKLQIE